MLYYIFGMWKNYFYFTLELSCMDSVLGRSPLYCDLLEYILRFTVTWTSMLICLFPTVLTIDLSFFIINLYVSKQHFPLIFFVPTHFDIYLLLVTSEQTVILILIFLLQSWINFATLTNTWGLIN